MPPGAGVSVPMQLHVGNAYRTFPGNALNTGNPDLKPRLTHEEARALLKIMISRL